MFCWSTRQVRQSYCLCWMDDGGRKTGLLRVSLPHVAYSVHPSESSPLPHWRHLKVGHERRLSKSVNVLFTFQPPPALLRHVCLLSSLFEGIMSTITMTHTTRNGTGPSTSGIELQSGHPFSHGTLVRPDSVDKRPTNSINDENFENQDIRRDLPPPSTAVDVLPRWNSPRSNMWRVMATFYAFLVFGFNDGAYGVMTPHMPPIDTAMLMSARLWFPMYFFPLLHTVCVESNDCPIAGDILPSHIYSCFINLPFPICRVHYCRIPK